MVHNLFMIMHLIAARFEKSPLVDYATIHKNESSIDGHERAPMVAWKRSKPIKYAFENMIKNFRYVQMISESGFKHQHGPLRFFSDEINLSHASL